MTENVFSEDTVGAFPPKQAPNKNVLFNTVERGWSMEDEK